MENNLKSFDTFINSLKGLHSEYLVKQRKKFKMSQSDLAKAIDVGPTAVSAVENKRAFFTIERYFRMSYYFFQNEKHLIDYNEMFPIAKQLGLSIQSGSLKVSGDTHRVEELEKEIAYLRTLLAAKDEIIDLYKGKQG